MNKKDLKLYAITDRSVLKNKMTMAEAVEEAILGGATIIQLREKHLRGEELRQEAVSIQKVCKTYKVPFIINDDVELAKEIDADGVHVGQSDMSVENARKILGDGKIVGATAKTIEQALTAQSQGADYLGSGAVFGTTTKLDAKPMSMELLTEICQSVNIPVVAIGGIDADNVGKLKEVPITGVAVVSGVFGGSDIRKSAKKIIRNLHETPVIECITNYVTVNNVANVVLASDASPIMAHNINEVEEVQINAKGLLLNLGATDHYDAMEKAYSKALELGNAVVIDPVGVGCISFRREFLKKLLKIGSPSCIRGNHSEIKAILYDRQTVSGLDDEKNDKVCSCEAVDSLNNDSSASEIEEYEFVRSLAKELGCIIVSSGETDVISDGNRLIKVMSGHEYQRKITGSGCMLSANICSEMAYVRPSAELAAFCCKRMGDMAYKAAEETISENKGIMTFQMKWIDKL